MADYFEMTKPDEEKGEKKDSPKEEKGEKKDNPFEKKDDGGGDKSGGKVDHFEDTLKMLKADFGVDLPADTTEKNGWEKLHSALTALKKHMGSAGAAPGAPPTLEAEPPPGGAMAMSLAKLQEDNGALQTALLEKDKEVAVLCGFNNKMQLSLIEKDLDTVLVQGRCTKAQRDLWLSRLGQVVQKHQFSLLRPDQSVDMAVICAEIRMAKSLPEGTFLPKSPAPVPTNPATQLSIGAVTTNGHTNGAANGTLVPAPPAAQPGDDPVLADPAKKAELDSVWKGLRMSLGIKD